MKKLLFGLISLFVFTFLATSPALALDEKLKITLTDLPDYKKTSEFRVYYTYFDTKGLTATVNLFIEKDGDGFRQTVDRDKTAVSGYFEVKVADLYAGQGKYNFYASAVTTGLTVNSGTVSIVLDQDPPGNVVDYHKERLSATDYKLYWKCPSDDDLEKTYIYRSTETSFIADSGTRVQSVSCSKDESKTTIVVGDADKDYYFALRAVDRAGNASGVVTDAPGEVTAGSVAGASTEVESNESGEVVSLPKEQGASESGDASSEGELGGGTSSQAGEVKGDSTSSIFTKNRNLLIGAGAGLLIVLGYLFLKKRKKSV